MRRLVKRGMSLLLCICMLFTMTACGKRTDVKKGDSYIFCLNGDRTGLVKISCDIPKKDTEKAAEIVLKELAKPAEDIEYSPAIPKPVKIKGYKINQMILYVDFDKSYEKLPSVEEKLVRAAVVQSLLQIDGIRGVWITVNGESLREADGSNVGILNEDDFVQNRGTSLSSYEQTTLVLYFANKEGDGLVQQKMDVKYSSNVSREKLIVEKLMKGPKDNGKAFPTMNPNVTLLGVTEKDGICYVNFDSEFLTGMYDVKPEIVIYSLVNSLIEGTQANRVQITVNGEKGVTFMDSIDLAQPFQRDLEWMKEDED